jgi:hypothetical protein
MYTRIQDRSVDEIAACASQYFEGESGAEEFRERLLRFSRQGHLRHRRRDGLKDGPVPGFCLSVFLIAVSVPRALQSSHPRQPLNGTTVFRNHRRQPGWAHTVGLERLSAPSGPNDKFRALAAGF